MKEKQEEEKQDSAANNFFRIITGRIHRTKKMPMTKTLLEYKPCSERYYTKSAKEHLNVPENPQSYLQHCIFAINSSILIFAGILGVIHAIIPNLFPFVTSEIVAKSCKKMIRIESSQTRTENIFQNI